MKFCLLQMKYSYKVFISHIIFIVLNLCSHIYKYLHMAVDSTVFHYLILYPKLVEKVKTHKLCPNTQHFGASSPEGKRREISVICEADVKSIHK